MMGFIELLLIAVGLSMDAFAVSITEGLCIKNRLGLRPVITGLCFGFFQAIMPLIGYALGYSFAHMIENFDHWVAFILLSIIGGKMIYESFKTEPENETCDIEINYRKLLTLGIATSIDALAVGLSFAFLKVQLVPALITIGITTFIISIIGVIIGFKLGNKFQRIAEAGGGFILVLIGIKILVEHLFT